MADLCYINKYRISRKLNAKPKVAVVFPPQSKYAHRNCFFLDKAVMSLHTELLHEANYEQENIKENIKENKQVK